MVKRVAVVAAVAEAPPVGPANSVWRNVDGCDLFLLPRVPLPLVASPFVPMPSVAAGSWMNRKGGSTSSCTH